MGVRRRVRPGRTRDHRAALRAAVAWLTVTGVAGGCHVTTRVEETVAGETTHRPRRGVADRFLPPAVTVTPAGYLRFAEPRVCVHDVVVVERDYQTVKKSANLATFIVGTIALSLGGLGAVIGMAEDQTLLTAAGGLGVALGLPLTIGPLIGNTGQRRLVGEREAIRGSQPVACGDRPMPASAAMVRYGTLQLLGSVDAEGRFSVSPFTVVDAFRLHQLPPLDLKVELFAAGDQRRSFRALVDATALAVGRDGYLTGLEVDPRIERLRKVPRVEPSALTITRATADSTDVIQIAATFTNSGPGDAWGVRGVLSARDSGIEGRIVYVGHLPANSSTTRTITLPLASSSVDLTEARIGLVAVDAHATTSMIPFRFRGPVLDSRTP